MEQKDDNGILETEITSHIISSTSINTISSEIKSTDAKSDSVDSEIKNDAMILAEPDTETPPTEAETPPTEPFSTLSTVMKSSSAPPVIQLNELMERVREHINTKKRYKSLSPNQEPLSPLTLTPPPLPPPLPTASPPPPPSPPPPEPALPSPPIPAGSLPILPPLAVSVLPSSPTSTINDDTVDMVSISIYY